CERCECETRTAGGDEPPAASTEREHRSSSSRASSSREALRRGWNLPLRPETADTGRDGAPLGAGSLQGPRARAPVSPPHGKWARENLARENPRSSRACTNRRHA